MSAERVLPAGRVPNPSALRQSCRAPYVLSESDQEKPTREYAAFRALLPLNMKVNHTATINARVAVRSVVLPSVLDAIDFTPMVRLDRVTDGVDGTLPAKLEYLTPGGPKGPGRQADHRRRYLRIDRTQPAIERIGIAQEEGGTVTDTVLQLLRERKQHGSTPGHRSDDARLVLLVEGGSSRGAYSSGMTVAIEQLGLLPLFDAVYGSSAGALNAAWLLCGRAESTLHAWWDPTIMRATIDPRRALRRRPVVDTHFLVHTVYTEIMPMGFQEILDSAVEFHPIATDALTGEVHRSARADPRPGQPAGRTPRVDGHAALDGRTRRDRRAAIRRRRGERVGPRPDGTRAGGHARRGASHPTRRRERVAPVARRTPGHVAMVRRGRPGALEPWLRREAIRAEEERLLASHPATLQIRPPLGSGQIGRTERRPSVLRAAVDTGRQAAEAELSGCIEELP